MNDHYKHALRMAQWEAEQNLPYDWQDYAVIWASCLAGVALLFISIWM